MEGAKFALDRNYTRERFLKYWKSDYRKPIMMNEVNFGDMRSHPKGGTKGWVEERQHLWAAFTSGGHAARSDFQPFTDTYPSLDSCLHLASFVRQIRFWEMSPLADFVLGCDGVCYSLGSDEEFVVYIRTKRAGQGRKVKLKLPQGDYRARWYDPVQGIFLADTEVVNGEVIELHIPKAATDIVLYVERTTEE
jgi:hypothetical protein